MQSPDGRAFNISPDSSPNSRTPSSGLASTKSGRVKALSCDFCRRLKMRNARNVRPETWSAFVPSFPLNLVRKVHIEAMENRIRQLESVITAAISSSENSDKLNTVSERAFEAQAEKPDTRSFVLNGETSFRFVASGRAKFQGSSSGFSIFSPSGFRWIAKKTGNRDLERVVSQVARLDLTSWHPGHWGKHLNVTWHPLPPEQRHELPNRATAFEYVEGYPATDPLRSPETIQILSDELPARYLRNATSAITDLQFGSPCLMSVQAIITMAIMLLGSSNPLAIETLVAIAARISHAIGLNRWLDDCGLSEQQLDERRNVFWMLYMIDKGVALYAGRPPVMHDQDIGVALPKSTNSSLMMPSGLPHFNTFVHAARLAMIESQVYSELYCPRARSRPALQKLKAVGILDAELQKWRREIPIHVRPESSINCDTQQFLPVLALHYSYYNCLNTIHRASIHYGPWTELAEERELVNHDLGLNPRVYDSESICVLAARDVINLLDHFKQYPAPPMFWMSVSQPLCASLTLFANILEHPNDPLAQSDLDLISSVTSLFGQLVAQGRLQFATGTLWIFQELYQIAKLYLSAPEALVAEPQPDTTNLESSIASVAECFDMAGAALDVSPTVPVTSRSDFNPDVWSPWQVDTNDYVLRDDSSFSPIDIR
ncbi:uncharacterized protein BDZ99DRAFT_482626 [Mytilinidion resinicola]|uniref:Xylanolytic transcriptional activator regulatory domain-containing protein n=1 Tax=Mytilinidion resinicola TaxID=574789 RepID=A0A6A6Y1S9_9PEZI|nr:uncharacterized protein BDZ99DRAFT_482626 [Mytilinidion resinicola]KAF2802771.1 hypothetical protein BDZ99DRAFT_482626 [Mytilinidion resinicola]